MIGQLTFVAIAGLLLSAPAAHAGTWGFAAGGALVSGYQYQRHEGFGGTGFPFAAVQRAIHSRLWLRAEAGYMGFVKEGAQHPPRVDWVPFGAGFRWQSVPGGSGLGTFLEFYPTLFHVRWRGETRYSFEVVPREYASFTRLVPGFMTGIGLHIRADERWHIDYGLRYHHSARLPEDLSGLHQVGFSVSLNWKPPVTRRPSEELSLAVEAR